MTSNDHLKSNFSEDGHLCDNLIRSINWTDVNYVIPLIIFSLLDMTVIIGNVMVIMAIPYTSCFRPAMNLFIVSLAVADLMIGILVLPASLLTEVYKVWIFGDLYCELFLILDIWSCTASILNICVISFHNYLAITRPIMYLHAMTMKRAKIMVGAVWIISFLISCSCMFGWPKRIKRIAPTHLSSLNDVAVDVEIFPSTTCPWVCALARDPGYTMFSSIGSFYLPILMMMFFYWRIYIAAVTATQALKQGRRAVPISDKQTNRSHLTLRIHRGRKSPIPSLEMETSVVDSIESIPAVVTKDFERMADTSHRILTVLHDRSNDLMNDRNLPAVDIVNPVKNPSPESSKNENPKSKLSNSKPNLKTYTYRFYMLETKAAKKLTFIVGTFIICWLPFFIIYVLATFCKSCVYPVIVSISSLLGYSNSAINPVLYAMFSRDFRQAFRRVFCQRCCGKLVESGSFVESSYSLSALSKRKDRY